jgi:hypothetical protein
MPKRTIGPFTGLQGLPAIDIDAAYADDATEAAVDVLLDRMQVIRDALEGVGCQCTGHAAGLDRDPEWGADICELVTRCANHDVHGTDDAGQATVESVSVKLESLQVEVDGNDEVVAWIYEES